MEQAEKEKIRRRNCKGEYIYRNQNDYFYPIATPVHQQREPYPWESVAHLPKITKDFFRCKGSSTNPSLTDASDPSKPVTWNDCEGSSRHGLPILSGKEGVYPVLVELLNYLQKKTGKRVIVTCGHRCPAHNAYSDPTKENRTSKHQIGAEVDFYVQGMEERPQEIVQLLMQYYQEKPEFKNDKEFVEFKRYEKSDTGVSTPPWLNKEIYIKIYQKQEGRDADNRHSHPYVSIQVRYDRSSKEKVLYSWEKANKGYPKS